MDRRSVGAMGLLALLSLGAVPLFPQGPLPQAPPEQAVPPEAARSEATVDLAVPLAAGMGHRFEPNLGLADPAVRFVGWGSDGVVLVRDDGLVQKGPAGEQRIGFAGASARPIAASLRPTRSFDYIGPDPAAWRLDVPHYGEVRYPALWPGVDLRVYFDADGRLEFDHELAPGADVRAIRIEVPGASLRPDGALDLPAGQLDPPVAYQVGPHGRIPVPSAYVELGGGVFGYGLPALDARLRTVIDPVLRFATYQGTIQAEANTAVVVHPHPTDAAKRRVYVVGDASSVGYAPGFNSTQTPYPASGAVVSVAIVDYNVVTKGRGAVALVHVGSTTGSTSSVAAAAAPGGRIVLLLRTTSAALPTVNPVKGDAATVPSNYDGAQIGGSTDMYIARLNATLVLDFATYVGGQGGDTPRGLAVDPSGRIAVTGTSAPAAVAAGNARPFPTRNAIRAAPLSIYTDLALAVVDPNQAPARFELATLYGDTYTDEGTAVWMDAASVWVGGEVDQSNIIPAAGIVTTPGAFQRCNAGSTNCNLQNDGGALLMRINRATPNQVAWATFLSGSGYDYVRAILVNPDGTVWVAGYTQSSNFPVCNNPVTPPMGNPCTTLPLQAAFGGGSDDMFITRVSADGSSLLYSSFFGGSSSSYGADWANAIGKDPIRGHLVISGYAGSTGLASTNALQSTLGGSRDAFILRFNPSASPPSAFFKSYLGGPGSEEARGMAIDDLGNIYLAGTSSASGFPLANATQATFGGGTNSDGTVVIIGPRPPDAAIRAMAGADSLVGQAKAPAPLSALATFAVPVGTAVAIDSVSALGDFPLQVASNAWTLYDATGTLVEATSGGVTPGFSPVIRSSTGSHVACLEVRDDSPATHPDGGERACIRILWDNDATSSSTSTPTSTATSTSTTTETSTFTSTTSSTAPSTSTTPAPTTTMPPPTVPATSVPPTSSPKSISPPPPVESQGYDRDTTWEDEVDPGYHPPLEAYEHAPSQPIPVREVPMAPGLPFLALAGPDQTVLAGDRVYLDGTGSRGTPPLQYLWRQVRGAPVQLHEADSPAPYFLATASLEPLAFELLVQDARGGFGTDEVQVRVRPKVAIAAAPAGGLSVRLLSDHAGLPHEWDFGDGAKSAEETPVHTFAAPGTYVVRLTVLAPDGLNATAVRTLTVEGAAPTQERSIPTVLGDAAALRHDPWTVVGVASLAMALLAGLLVARFRRNGA